MRRAPLLLTALVLAASTATGQPADTVDPGPIAMTLVELEEEIRRREHDLERYNEQLAELERENAELRRELDAHGADLARQERQVRARLVTLCRLSRGGYLQLLGGASSWADLFRRAQFARTLVDQEMEALNEHQRQVEALEERRGQLDQRLAAQRRLRERIAGYREELEAERERRLVERRQPDPLSLGGSTPPPYDFNDSWEL